MSKEKQAPRLQYAALPYRFRLDGSVEILLVTTRRTGRWIIPKGWKIKGKKPAKSASQEAFEEAGVRGTVSEKPIGSFVYDKWLDDDSITAPCEVRVFPLLVKRQAETWRESREREVRWVDPGSVLQLVEDQGLRDIIETFLDRLSNNVTPAVDAGLRHGVLKGPS